MPVKRQKNGKWDVSGSERGIRFHKVLPSWTKKSQANTLERKIRADILNSQELGHAPEISIGEAIMRYKKEYQGKAFPESHARSLGSFVIGKNLSELVQVADTVRTTTRGSGSTINRRLAILKRVAHLAYKRWGWLDSPLHEKIEMLPENPARQVYLTRSELARLLWNIRCSRYATGTQHRISREFRRAALVLAFTGLRKGELLALKPEDIRGNMICLSDSKNGKPRNVPILRDIAFALRRLPFTFDPTSLSHAVARASGGKVRVHDLRHTCASLLVQAGVPIYTVAAILGNPSAVKRYAHLDTRTMEDAVAKLTPIRKPSKQEKAA